MQVFELQLTIHNLSSQENRNYKANNRSWNSNNMYKNLLVPNCSKIKKETHF